ncbi:unnamed protein product [Enterobius vermicularis]|uniref:Ovule protein n=1 Tax=Enterobius vermicularis TaxID=51028 RepID=A0A0N4VNB2_ENTVE|nr:unnamed protein product [Enterobius vermicularis]
MKEISGINCDWAQEMLLLRSMQNSCNLIAFCAVCCTSSSVSSLLLLPIIHFNSVEDFKLSNVDALNAEAANAAIVVAWFAADLS